MKSLDLWKPHPIGVVEHHHLGVKLIITVVYQRVHPYGHHVYATFAVDKSDRLQDIDPKVLLGDEMHDSHFRYTLADWLFRPTAAVCEALEADLDLMIARWIETEVL